jgi:hypothetical protein
MDAPQLHDEIIATLGSGTECHKRGDAIPDRAGKTWKNDIWEIEAPIPEEVDIAIHLKWLSEYALKHEEQIRRWMQAGARVDLYFSYCCDHDHCGFGLDPELLSVFPKLGIRFEMSIMT